MLANIADQSHLNYLALQNVFEALRELSREQTAKTLKEKKTTSLKKNKPFKHLKVIKKGFYQYFDSISRSHLNSRLWLKARRLFVQYMFNQLNDIGKVKAHDNSIVSDFADLKYYCEKGVYESNEVMDDESKCFFLLIEISVELLRGFSLKSCLKKLNIVLKNLLSKYELSEDGFIIFLKTSILVNDIEFPINLLECQNRDSKKNDLKLSIDDCIKSLLALQKFILNDMSKNGGEKIESFTDSSISYFDNVYKEIKNLFNPLLHYLIHVKLRLGSSLMIKSSDYDRKMADPKLEVNKFWEHSLNVLGSAIEINKVISERSLNLEIELFYKYSYCMKQLFVSRKIGTLNDVVDSYGHTINLIQKSVHDLYLIKQCYLEIAVLFIFSFDPTINLDSNKIETNQTPASKSRAIEAALAALAFAVDTTHSMKEKMLLTGNEQLKNMASTNICDCPIFISNDLVANHVFAERKRLYRDVIEEEVLSLAPEFEIVKEYKSYDDKADLLSSLSDKYITWIHVLNYQKKLQSISTMRNLNTLRNGNKRFIYSDIFTIGLTPIFLNSHLIASRLCQTNTFLKNRLEIYTKSCQAKEPIAEFFHNSARKLNAPINSSKSLINLPAILKYVKVYNENISNNISLAKNDLEDIVESLNLARSKQEQTVGTDWSYLQTWPANFNYSNINNSKVNENISYDSLFDYVLTMNWHKHLMFVNDETGDEDDKIICIIGLRDKLTSNKIKFKFFSAGKIIEIHEK